MTSLVTNVCNLRYFQQLRNKGLVLFMMNYIKEKNKTKGRIRNLISRSYERLECLGKGRKEAVELIKCLPSQSHAHSTEVFGD